MDYFKANKMACSGFSEWFLIASMESLRVPFEADFSVSKIEKSQREPNLANTVAERWLSIRACSNSQMCFDTN